MPKRTANQRTGSLGHRQAAAAFERLGSWIVRNQEEDFGVDLELELSNPHPSADFLKCQIKSGVAPVGGFRAPLRLENSFVRYCCECRVPFLLVRVDTATGNLWFCWIQEFVSRTHQELAVFMNAKSSFIFPQTSFTPLNNETNEQLQAIASGTHPYTASSLARGLLRTAFRNKDYSLIGKATDILARDHDRRAYIDPREVIDIAIALGDKIFQTSEGNAVTGLLLYLADSYPAAFTAHDIEILVRRGESYSRVGIAILSQLYDADPSYVASLGLPRLFEGNFYVRYFCLLREKFADRRFHWLGHAEYNALAGYVVDKDDDVWEKSLTRGPSALLDYVYWDKTKGPPPTS